MDLTIQKAQARKIVFYQVFPRCGNIKVGDSVYSYMYKGLGQIDQSIEECIEDSRTGHVSFHNASNVTGSIMKRMSIWHSWDTLKNTLVRQDGTGANSNSQDTFWNDHTIQQGSKDANLSPHIYHLRIYPGERIIPILPPGPTFSSRQKTRIPKSRSLGEGRSSS